MIRKLLTAVAWLALTRLACAATGSVELVGTQIGSSGSNGGSGNTIAKVIDADFATFYDAANATGDWVGVDAGSACTVTSWKFAPRRGASGITQQSQYEDRMWAGKVQASSAAAFGSDVTDCDTVPATPAYLSREWNQRSTTSPPSKRYWRYLGPTGGRCNIAELRFIATAGPTSAKPVQPTVSPWGGHYNTGAVTVTLASATTSASIYYTVDGSTPDNTDTLYSGPFSLDCSPGMTLKVIAYDASLSTTSSDVSTAVFKDYDYAPRDNSPDIASGNEVQCFGGGIMCGPGGAPLLVGGYYYRYGNNFNRYNVITSFDGGGIDGVWCYRSTDMVNWELVGNILPNPYAVSAPDFYIIRPHVIYNSGTAKYVMWCHVFQITGFATNKALVATADAPGGPWTVINDNLNPDGQTFRGPNLFQDNDGTAYVIYNAATFDTVVSQLSSNYLTTTGSPVVISALAAEGVCMTRIGNVYVLMAGDVNYYDSAADTINCRYVVSSSPTSGYSSSRYLFFPIQDTTGTNYNGQPTCLFHYRNGLVLLSDFWIASDLTDSRDVWVPIDFNAATPASWNWSRFAGQSNTLQTNIALAYQLDELSGDAQEQVSNLDATQTGTCLAAGLRIRGRVFSNGNLFTHASAADFQAAASWWGSVWFRREDTASFPCILSKDGAGGSREYALYLDSSDSYKVNFLASSNGTATTSVTASSFGATTTNTWYHVLFGQSGGNLFVCVNNGTVNTTASSGIVAGANTFRIGAGQAGSIPFIGTINRTMFWKRTAPSSDERTALYNSGIGLNYDQLAAATSSSGNFLLLLSSLERAKWQPIDKNSRSNPFTYAIAP